MVNLSRRLSRGAAQLALATRVCRAEKALRKERRARRRAQNAQRNLEARTTRLENILSSIVSSVLPLMDAFIARYKRRANRAGNQVAVTRQSEDTSIARKIAAEDKPGINNAEVINEASDSDSLNAQPVLTSPSADKARPVKSSDETKSIDNDLKCIEALLSLSDPSKSSNNSRQSSQKPSSVSEAPYQRSQNTQTHGSNIRAKREAMSSPWQSPVWPAPVFAAPSTSNASYPQLPVGRPHSTYEGGILVQGPVPGLPIPVSSPQMTAVNMMRWRHEAWPPPPPPVLGSMNPHLVTPSAPPISVGTAPSPFPSQLQQLHGTLSTLVNFAANATQQQIQQCTPRLSYADAITRQSRAPENTQDPPEPSTTHTMQTLRPQWSNLSSTRKSYAPRSIGILQQPPESSSIPNPNNSTPAQEYSSMPFDPAIPSGTDKLPQSLLSDDHIAQQTASLSVQESPLDFLEHVGSSSAAYCEDLSTNSIPFNTTSSCASFSLPGLSSELSPEKTYSNPEISSPRMSSPKSSITSAATCSPVSKAAVSGDGEVAEPSSGEELSPQKTPPLVTAANNNMCGLLRELLEEGADANARSRKGVTALLCAVRQGHMQAANLLLQHGADPSLPNNLGHTPLHEAATGRDASFVAMLIDAGACVNACDLEGRTPLVAAMNANREKNVHLLLNAGATCSLL